MVEYKAELLNDREILLIRDPARVVTFRLRESKLIQLDKIVATLNKNYLKAETDKKRENYITRTMLIQRVIERIIDNPELLELLL